MTQRRRFTALPVVLLVLLVATAGCSGLLPSDGPTGPDPGEGTETTQATTAPTATPTDAGTPTATPTPTPTVAPPGTAGDAVNVTALLAAHRQALDGRSHTVRYGYESGTFSTSLVARVAADAARVRSNRTGERVDTYVADGAVYRERTVPGSDRTYYQRPTAPPEILRSEVAGLSRLRRYFRDATFHRTGQVERNGTALAVLTAGVEDVRDDAFRGEVTAFDARALVDDRGLVRSLSVSVSRETTYGTTDRSTTVRTTAVGETTVSAPDWTEKTGVSTPFRTFTPEGLDARVRVHAERSVLDDARIDTDALQYLRGDLTDARASPYVQVVTFGPVDRYQVALGYDDSEVPDGDESGLALYAYNRSLGTFVRMDSRVDAANDTVTARTIAAGQTFVVGRGEDARTITPVLRGEWESPPVFVVMHTETWLERFR